MRILHVVLFFFDMLSTIILHIYLTSYNAILKKKEKTLLSVYSYTISYI